MTDQAAMRLVPVERELLAAAYERANLICPAADIRAGNKIDWVRESVALDAINAALAAAPTQPSASEHNQPAGEAEARFNINDTVWIKLTNEGREYHRRWHTERYPMLTYRAPDESADGWSKWQLWSLMQDFGSAIHMGGRVPFETTIRLSRPTPAASVAEMPTDAQVREAMQDAWDTFCDDAQAIPGDIRREGRKTYFVAGTWADHTAMALRAIMERALPDTASGGGEG